MSLTERQLFYGYRAVRERAGVIAFERIAHLAESLADELSRIDLAASGLDPDALGELRALVRDIDAARLSRLVP